MPDLVLDWADIGAYGTFVPNTAPGTVGTTVDTGGIAVDITHTISDPGAAAVTFNASGFVAPGETFDSNSWLKLFSDGPGVDGAAPAATSSATLDFRSTDAAFSDEVQDVAFRLSDIDTSATDGDNAQAGDGWEDVVSVLAFNADGDPVPVTLTPTGGVDQAGSTLTGTSTTEFTDGEGSVLVEIAGPVARVEIVYENGDEGPQALLVSDVEFSTVDSSGDPVAVDDTATTDQEVAVVVDVLANDSDPDGDPLTVTSATAPNGSIVINGDNTLTYTPDAGFTGPDTITYTIEDPSGNSATGEVAVTVDPLGNADPVAVDDSVSTALDTPVTLDPADNDTDSDGDPLEVASVGTPTNGAAVLNPDGTVTYTPDAGFTGSDTIPYVVDDGNGGTDTGEIVVTVGGANTPPVAVDDTASTTPGTPVTLDPSANDTDGDGDPLEVASVGTPTNGAAVLNPDGTVTYTPDAGFTGDDTIPYVVDDGNGGTDTGEIVVTVGTANTPPVAVDDTATTTEGDPVTLDPAANDTDGDGDPLEVASVGTPTNGAAVLNPDGTVTYTPDAGFTGEDTIPYIVEDPSGATDTGEIVVTVSAAGPGRIDTDVFPVDAALQPIDPLDGLDEDPDPSDDLDNEFGTSGSDTITTGDDDDTITGRGGDDVINPGIDDDSVLAGAGDDTITDEQGADTIFGGDGNDSINAGVDTFSDFVGDASAAELAVLTPLGFDSDPNPDDGRDLIFGEDGDDTIFTGDDADTIDGGRDNDSIDAGIDNDSVLGGLGNDTIFGRHGSDTIDGGNDDDFIDGSARADLAIPDASDPVTDNDRDSLIGGLGNDTILGGDDDDTLLGGVGDDSLDGGIDEDTIFGDEGADTILGGDGDDTLQGGAGADSISGGEGRDTIIVERATWGRDDTVDGGAAGDDFDVLDLSGVGVRGTDWRLVDTSTDSNGNGIDGTIEFLDSGGDVTGSFDFFEIEQIVPCFTPGTLIATPEGERLVEDLNVGDRVITRDNGIQEIRWAGRKDLTGHDLARQPHLQPVMIRKGALGNNLPEHDMLVSPNHRVLVANDKTALYFEEREVLVAAKHLTGLDGVESVERLGVSYVHIMFDQHEVVLSNGAWTESFQPGDYSLKGIGNAQRQEILELFPELAEEDGLRAYASARRSLKKHEAALLTQS